MNLPVVLNPVEPLCPAGCRTGYVRRGFYSRRNGSREQRFRCKGCRHTFCAAVHHISYREKRRDLRRSIMLLMVSGVTQRRMARLLCAHRITIVRKIIRLGILAQHISLRDLPVGEVKAMQFDDLETYEHTKCKPLSITLAVEGKTRQILGVQVSQMPAKGHLAAIALKKYGVREDLRSAGRQDLFARIQDVLAPDAVIRSDKNPHYVADVKKFWPNQRHEVFKGRKPSGAGLGELKKGAHDPLFSLNHSCAMLRANICRLFRKTWNTTKRPDRLALHLAIYAIFHNRYLIRYPSR